MAMAVDPFFIDHRFLKGTTMVTNNDNSVVVDDKSAETIQTNLNQAMDDYAKNLQANGISGTGQSTRSTEYLPNFEVTLSKAEDDLLKLNVINFATKHKLNWDFERIAKEHQMARDDWFDEKTRPWRQQCHKQMVEDGKNGIRYQLRYGKAGCSDARYHSYFCMKTTWTKS
jgi:hypothetical protein